MVLTFDPDLIVRLFFVHKKAGQNVKIGQYSRMGLNPQGAYQ